MKKTSLISLLLTAVLLVSIAFPASALEPSSEVNGVFVVYFEANGGTGVPVIATTTSSGKLSQLPTPVMNGYTFEGWYTDELEGDKITFNTEFDADTTIYAHWIPNLKDTSSSVVSTPAQPAKSFNLKAHAGTLLVAGTLLFTFVVISTK